MVINMFSYRKVRERRLDATTAEMDLDFRISLWSGNSSADPPAARRQPTPSPTPSAPLLERPQARVGHGHHHAHI